MVTPLMVTLALVTAPQAVQVPVEAPRLPEGRLMYVGPFGPNRLYVDAPGWERSDLPGLVRGTVVILTPGDEAPVQVMRAWIDCDRRTYQFSAGRAYNTAGVEFAATGVLPDQPVGDAGPMKQLADRVCAMPMDLASMPSTQSWRVALEETRMAAP